MPIGHIHERLLELPLFQGMSNNDLNQVVAHTKFGFLKFSKNKIVVSEGEECKHIYFLMSGVLSVSGRSDDGSYTIEEVLMAPNVLQPERIFGWSQRFTRTFIAASNCSMARIDKSQVMELTAKFEIFRLNLLNIVSTKIQRLSRQPWRQQPHGIRQKIARFTEEHCLHPAGKKTLHIKMETLAQAIHESRLNVSRELNRMNEEGLIRLSRETIEIPALENLIAQ